jgi:hypothetical protein
MSKVAAGCSEKQSSRGRYWDNTSRGLIKTIGMAMVEFAPPDKINLGQLANIIFDDPLRYAQFAVQRIKNDKLAARLMRYARPGTSDVKSIREVIQNTCTQLEFLNGGADRGMPDPVRHQDR